MQLVKVSFRIAFSVHVLNFVCCIIPCFYNFTTFLKITAILRYMWYLKCLMLFSLTEYLSLNFLTNFFLINSYNFDLNLFWQKIFWQFFILKKCSWLKVFLYFFLLAIALLLNKIKLNTLDLSLVSDLIMVQVCYLRCLVYMTVRLNIMIILWCSICKVIISNFTMIQRYYFISTSSFIILIFKVRVTLMFNTEDELQAGLMVGVPMTQKLAQN